MIHSIQFRTALLCLIVACTGLAHPVLAQDDSPTDLWTRKGEDWPRFLGNDIDGVSSETGILKDWTGGKLKTVWTLETGEGYGMGVVSAGRFFHFGKYKDQATLKCVHAETGEALWEFSYPSDYQDLYGYDAGPRASPLVEGNRVYIFGVEGMLHCLDVTSGKVIWKINTEAKFGVKQNFFGVGSSPVIFKDKLLVMIGGSPEASQQVPLGMLNRVKPNGSGVVAFDKMTGKVIYKAVDDLASYSSLKLMERSGETILLAWMREALHGLDPNTGKKKFSFPWRATKLESVNAATPLVLGDKVLITESYQFGAALLDLRTDRPQLLWSDKGIRKQSLASHWNTPVVDGNFLYGCSGEKTHDAEMRCLNWKTGEVRWKKGGLGRGSFVKIDGHLILLGERNQLLLLKLDSNRYSEVTRYSDESGNPLKLGAPTWPAPIVSHGLMYVRGTRKLACLELIPNANEK